YEMNWLERVGLLKMDYLGLASLTIMRRACELIKQRHNVEFDLGNIPVDDPKAFDLLARGDVTGVFQVEGSGMRKVLQQLRPTKFEHVVATISLYRPGPMEHIGTYINRLHGKERVEYKHPKLKQVLDETFGIIVYQEQIIQAAVVLAGYKPGEADEIRKAVGKKIKEKIEAHREKFVKGAVANGIDRLVAEAIYGDIEYFARYGFNKAHAANYAVLTCQTAYLKAYYPLEYMTALLMTDIGNVEKIGQLVSEARRMGYEILPPSVNASDVNFTITPDNKGIHFALGAIKNVGFGAVEVIVEARNPSASSGGSAFKSLDDFCRRVDLRSVNRRVLESLIKAGAMDSFGRRSQLLKVLDRMMTASQNAHQASDRGQLSMFGAVAATSGLSADTFGTLPDELETSNRDKLADEKELTGAYFSDNPLMRLARSSSNRVTHFANQLDESLARQTIALAGVVTSVRVITTKKGDPMAFVSLEDPSGATEITIFPKTFERSRELWRNDALLLVKGKVELRDGKIQVLCDSAEEYQIPIDDGRPTTDVPPPAVSGQPSAVQYAMPDAEEAALADVVAEIPMDDGAFLPPPPEEPPSEFSKQPIVNSSQRSAGGGQNVNGGNGGAPVAKSNGGNGGVYAPISEPARVIESATRYQAVRHLRIFLARTNDYDEDVRRMRELLSLLASADGRDRFTFYVPNPQGVVQLDFPNHSTSYSQVQGTLDELMGQWGTLEVQ
ncbi:MAG: DNA polymerase III subunit alpha, partial [Anaerolineales bacterium]|nr:DNA polymerase III subunit alpha [Anaerolineales bacterium]